MKRLRTISVLAIIICMLSLFSFSTSTLKSDPPGITSWNSVLSIGISGTRGGSVDSLKVLGTETIDAADMGRMIQASLFFAPGDDYYPWWNPQEAGDTNGVASPIYAIGGGGQSTQINVGVHPRDWLGRGILPAGLRIEGHHKVGPLAYCNVNEVAYLKYQIYSDQQNLTFAHQVADSNNDMTPVPYLPAVYFKDSVLTRLFGLSMDGTTWVEVTPYTAGQGCEYCPTQYKYKAMAWMKNDLSWGVGLYGRWTLNQDVNYVAEKFPSGNTNLLALVDQDLGTLQQGQGVEREAHIAVGNLDTIKGIFNWINNAGH